MKLSDVIDNLVYGILNQHYAGSVDEITGYTNETRQLMALINAGTRDLHNKLVIFREHVRIVCTPLVTRYVLDESLVYLDGLPPDKEVLQILSVKDKNGRFCVLNGIDTGIGTYLSTPAPNVIATNGYSGVLDVEYRAASEMLPIPPVGSNVNPMTVDIDLPDHYLEALTLFVGSRIFITTLPDAGLAASNSPAQMFLKLYEAECQNLVTQGLHNDTGVQSFNRFRDKGFI